MKKANPVDKDRILYIPSKYSGGNLCVQGKTCKIRNVLNPSSFSSAFNEGLHLPADLPSQVLIAINTILTSLMWCKETVTIVSTLGFGFKCFVLYLV